MPLRMILSPPLLATPLIGTPVRLLRGMLFSMDCNFVAREVGAQVEFLGAVGAGEAAGVFAVDVVAGWGQWGVSSEREREGWRMGEGMRKGRKRMEDLL